MRDKSLPIRLPPRVKSLCDKLDDFYRNYKLDYKASDLIMGIYYLMSECRSNPDWMSQAAHSAREVLYPFFSKESEEILEKEDNKNILKVFNKYVTDNDLSEKIDSKNFKETFRSLNEIYKKLSDLAHHCSNPRSELRKEECLNFSEKEFEELIERFVLTLNKVLDLQQFYIHALIDTITRKKPPKPKEKSKKKDIEVILKTNLDARQYFYEKVDEDWFNFLYKNGFIDISDAVKTCSPETRFIIRIASGKKSKFIADEINKFRVGSEKNPEIVIELFLRIMEKLPAQFLNSLIKKIQEEQWIKIANSRWHLSHYEKILENLNKERQYKLLLNFIKILLTVKSKDEIEENQRINWLYINPFYFDDLIKVFEYLESVPNNYETKKKTKQNLDFVEKAFCLCVDVLEKVIVNFGEKSKNTPFKFDEKFLRHVNFSDKKLNERDSNRDTLVKLVQVIKSLDKQLQKDSEAYNKLFNLPDSQLSWRLKLSIIASNPAIFKNELKDHIFRLFKTKEYRQIISNEYLTCLEKGFPSLSSEIRNNFLNKVLEYFSSLKKEDESSSEYASYVLYRIKDSFEESQFKKRITEHSFSAELHDSPRQTKPQLKPVRPRGPVTEEEFSKLSLNEIVDKLCREWSPKSLSETQGRDPSKPVNEEGISELIKEDMKKRLEDYMKNATRFFDPENLHPAYTYAFLQGLINVIGENADKLKGYSDHLLSFLLKIKEHENLPIDQQFSSNISPTTWKDVHLSLCDLLNNLLNIITKDPEIIDFSKNRVLILKLINYLLKYPDPNPQNEDEKNVKYQNNYLANSSYNIAINSVKGKAFKCIVNYVLIDNKISDKIKRMYESLLRHENTRSIMFLFGYYFPFFYSKNVKWTRSQIDKIFKKENFNLFISAWEGYLIKTYDIGTRNPEIFEELFFDPALQKLYEYCIDLEDLPSNREYDLNPREGLARHLALAYILFGSFEFGHKLFDQFLNKSSPKQISYFVNEIGQHLSQNNLPIKSKEKLKRLWDWMLEYYDDEKIFYEFGLWIRPKFFETCWLANRLKKTLKKTRGDMDIFKLEEPVVKLAQKCPGETIDIISLFLNRIIKRKNEGYFLNLKKGDSWYEAIKIIYNSNEKNKEECEKLINDLIKKGGKDFWNLKQIIK